jgi:siroheme synthase
VLFATPRAAPQELPSTWAQAAAASDTVVLYMAAGDAQAVRDALLGAGMRPGMPVVVAENASLPEKNIVKGQLSELPDLSARCSGGPALLLIGEVFKEDYLEKIGSDPIYRALIASQRA